MGSVYPLVYTVEKVIRQTPFPTPLNLRRISYTTLSFHLIVEMRKVLTYTFPTLQIMVIVAKGYQPLF